MKLKTIASFVLISLAASTLGLNSGCSLSLENNPASTRAALEKESRRLPGHPKTNASYTYQYLSD